LVGLLNSFIVLKIGMPSFFATLCTSFFVSGMAIWLIQGAWIYVGDKIPFLSNGLAPSPFLGLPPLFLALLPRSLSATYYAHLAFHLTAVGGRQAAESTGSMYATKTLCFVFVQACARASRPVRHGLWERHGLNNW
jgi:ribose/xylose/arabinose/galactoside ABC-type transport system permease subunit